MISRIHDALLSTVVPSLENQDLACFAFTSKGVKALCLPEILKRSNECRNWLNAIFFLDRKVCSYLEKQSEPILQRVQAILLRFIENSEFTFLSSISFEEAAWQSLKRGLDIIEWQEKFCLFCRDLEAGQENEMIIQASIRLLEKHPAATSRYIYLDVNQSDLSLGNLVSFSLAKKTLELDQDVLKMYDVFGSSVLYHSPGHKAIILTGSDVSPEEVRSQDSLLKLSQQVSSLTELRMLQIRVETMVERSNSCFQAILEGAISLPKLICISFELWTVTNLQMKKIAESLAIILGREDNTLNKISIQCTDISLGQVGAFIRDIDIHLRKNIILDLGVFYRTCSHLEELENVESFSTHFITVNFRIII